ncbi:uncharacterized protein LTR77_000399 [Saxophila tyrrhenica]|uniref:Extradiol ring-cleavage dioxygenase class III enzyme subunit B domain-containing protein n=1 Tax=Saxophila tyrrhenica TaxID=1690608 RepID=A0AAV9PN65_9PEZI|nr:hypothetical protein LTR77_000399 [Saxophila tyrrhenica]
MPRTPVYFFSHGGPNLKDDTTHPAYSTLQGLGREITHTVRPKALLVISAHWQPDHPNTIQVSSPSIHSLLYDYYGFPSDYYNLNFPATGSPELAGRVIGLLKEAGIKAEGVERRLDHGVFIPFMVAFDPKENPLSMPVVQISLFNSDDGAAHYALGAALEGLRDEGVVIVASGMAVHNLRDFRRAMMGGFVGGRAKPMGYCESFDEALREAVEKSPEERKEAMTALLKRRDSREAHPSFEHLLPVFVGAGAAGSDKGDRLWTLCEGSLSWGMVRFGEVAGEA